MQLVITAPAAAPATTEAPATADITWITKGGSSIVSHDGRWALRKNSKGQWKIVDSGDTIRVNLADKDEAKAIVNKLVTSEAAPATDIKAALLAGEARVYSLRGNGTMRRRHFLTGEDLVAAQAVQAQRDAGKGLAFIADSLHVSVSHVRRMLVDLAITEELMEAEADELAAIFQGAAE